MEKHPFVKFVSGVKGRLVSRYGSARAKLGPSIIGGVKEPMALPDHGKPTSFLARGAAPVSIDESIIVALTEDEWNAYRREYTRALRDGSLRERSEEDYWAWVKAPAVIEKEQE